MDIDFYFTPFILAYKQSTLQFCFYFFLFFKFFIKVQLIYNVQISAIHKVTQSYIYIHTHSFFIYSFPLWSMEGDWI